MTEPSLLDRQRPLLHNLFQRAQQRAQLERSLAETLQTRTDEADREHEAATRTEAERYETEKQAADLEQNEARTAIETRYENEHDASLTEYNEARKKLERQYGQNKEKIETAHQESEWHLDTVFEGSKDGSEAKLREEQTRIRQRLERAKEIEDEARDLLREWKQPTSLLDLATPVEAEKGDAGKDAEAEAAAEGKEDSGKGDPNKPRKLQEWMAEAQAILEELQQMTLPLFLRGKRRVGLILLTFLLLIGPCGWVVAKTNTPMPPKPQLVLYGTVGSAVLTVVLSVAGFFVLGKVARAKVRSLTQPLAQALAEARARGKHLEDIYVNRSEQEIAAAQEVHDRDLQKVEAQYKQKLASLDQQRDQIAPRIEKQHQDQLAALTRRRDDGLAQVQARYQKRSAANEQWHEADTAKINARHEQQLAQVRADHERDWNAMAAAWRHAVNEARTEITAINAENTRLYPDWDDPAWKDWSPPPELPGVVRFGRYAVKEEQIPDAVPADEPLKDARPGDFSLPAYLGFPDHYSTLFEAEDEGRDAAIANVRAIMFRLLTTLPPGKVRFTIIDPVGLGENFASFMHLTDYDEMLVSSRIWTEAVHIEQRLSDLTAHMENVIQKYLRDRYETISDYNAMAGEVAEPFRIVVVANYPTNFTDAAVRRLLSIAQSGPRCGVSVLVTADTKLPNPRGFTLADLEKSCVTLVWDKDHFQWKDEDFGPFALTTDAPPSTSFSDPLLNKIGAMARDAGKVEVPFDFIAPAPEQVWTMDSRAILDVPLGRAGATRRQHLKLGVGTSQHVVVAGKTGSGKSTLMHALITNAALFYSPEEVEFYLIDFKKGVEFRTYAHNEMPHARVVAIESEREFGLSVLQRLDGILKERGDIFRDAGAQDVKSYRAATGKICPRILLVIDEFQEFFTEDDRISQDAAQLLDRLVRQGRAFGLHVLLGSQTLGGAFSLARSTIDQMAIRIALQCSEADAQLILSADNAAARLLTRPGEAIYNDANGMVEGNNPFQVVWLPEQRREKYLIQMRDLAKQRRLHLTPALVFEGNAPADVSKNYPLQEMLGATCWPADVDGGNARNPPLAWLGEAMTLKGSTAIPFRRINGSNLAIVGQQEEAAQSMLAMGVISLATQLEPDATAPLGVSRFYVLDGSVADAPKEGVLARLPDVVPHPVKLGGSRQTAAVLAEIGAEMERRNKANDIEAPALFLVLYGLHRFRDLRRQEDDFGFMRKEEKVTPTQQFADILREGPGVGIHVMFWCDTLNNLNRCIERQSMREVALRVVFQMSVSDSSSLIDSPLASKLGAHRAFFSSEEEGRLEKFRPYGTPSDDWLNQVKQQLAGRNRAPAPQQAST